MKRIVIAAAAVALFVGSGFSSHAAVIVESLGNTGSGFADGSFPTAPEVGVAVGGQSAPFNGSIGSDILTSLGPFSASWTFNYAPIVDPIIGAAIEIGIWDHDSVATGSQVASFSVEGTSLTGQMDALFEGKPGEDLQFHVYSLDITSLLVPDLSVLADGSAVVSLDLQGPGRVTPLFPLPGPNPSEDSVSNGAALIYSTLTITTQVSPVDIPVPAALPLFGTGLALLGFVGWRRKRAAAA